MWGTTVTTQAMTALRTRPAGIPHGARHSETRRLDPVRAVAAVPVRSESSPEVPLQVKGDRHEGIP